jgi:hypothetical protein
MNGRDLFLQKGQAMVEVLLTGIALQLASWSGKFFGMAAQACELTRSTQWAAWVVLRWMLLLANCHGASVYLYDSAGLLHQLPRIVASLWRLLWALALRGPVST